MPDSIYWQIDFFPIAAYESPLASSFNVLSSCSVNFSSSFPAVWKMLITFIAIFSVISKPPRNASLMASIRFSSDLFWYINMMCFPADLMQISGNWPSVFPTNHGRDWSPIIGNASQCGAHLVAKIPCNTISYMLFLKIWRTLSRCTEYNNPLNYFLLTEYFKAMNCFNRFRKSFKKNKFD